MKPFPALAVLLALCLAGLAGCGSDLEEAAPAQTQVPTPAATEEADPGPEIALSADVRRQLEAGEVGVVDFANEVAVRPARLLPNKDQAMRGIEWTGWGDAQAVGRGTLETLICEPTCAQGQTVDVDAVLELSEPRACGSRRYYGRAALTYTDPETDKRRDPAVFLRTPC